MLSDRCMTCLVGDLYPKGMDMQNKRGRSGLRWPNFVQILRQAGRADGGNDFLNMLRAWKKITIQVIEIRLSEADLLLATG